MSLRWQFTRDSRFIIPYKVEIYDSEYEGSPITLNHTGGVPLEIEMGRQGEDPDAKIKSSFCTVRLFGHSGDFEDLFSRDLNRFKIRVYKDGEFDSEFIPLPDTFNDYIQEGLYTVEIKGANLSLLRQRDAWEVLEVDEDNPGTMNRLMCIIALVEDLFDLPVVDGSIFHLSNLTPDQSALFFQRVPMLRIEGMTSYEALELLIPQGHQYRVGRGKVWIIPQQEAEWTGYEYTSSGFVDSHTVSDNFIAVFKGQRYSTPRTKLPQYDGVRRIYDPLEGENAIPSGELLPEDFGIENPSQRQTVQFPDGWERVNYPGTFNTHLVSSSVGSNRWAWRIPESVPPAQNLPPVQFRATSKQVSSGQRLLIRLTLDYESRNGFAIFPVIIRVGNQILRNDYFTVGEPQWQTESPISDFNTYDIGMTANTGYTDFEILTPPIPATDVFSFDIFSPSPDGASWRISSEHFLDIAELTAEVADENGDILLREETLAGSKGDVYEYTEGFGDGFSFFHPGAIFRGFVGDSLTENWRLKGSEEDLSLSELEVKYLYSQLSRDLDRISGTADVFDTIALIEGKRVNYISTDFRYGNSRIELVEIREHDLEATIEKRRERSPGRHGGGGGSPFDLRPDLQRLNAIGEITRDYTNELTDTIDARLGQPIRSGIEYWIVNESELTRTDRDDGIYPIIPQTTDSQGNRLLPGEGGYVGGIRKYGPGLLEGDNPLPIQEQVVNAPAGSIILKSPGQEEKEQQVGEENDELVSDLDEKLVDLDEKLEELDVLIDDLNNNILPELNEKLDGLESELNTLDGYFENPSTIPSGYNFFTGIVAEDAFINSLVARQLFTDELVANTAFVNALAANTVFTDELVANNGFIETLVARQLFADELVANSAFIAELMTQSLVLANPGQITNTNNDFGIDPSGIFIRDYAGQITSERSYSIRNSIGDSVFDIAKAAGDATFFTARQGNMVFTRAGSGGDFVINMGDGGEEIIFLNVRNTEPGGAGVGGTLFTQTASQLGGSGSTKVLCVA